MNNIAFTLIKSVTKDHKTLQVELEKINSKSIYDDITDYTTYIFKDDSYVVAYDNNIMLYGAHHSHISIGV